ncbi:hypothetical protein Dimus_017495 [Dionaea muscipula]
MQEPRILRGVNAKDVKFNADESSRSGCISSSVHSHLLPLRILGNHLFQSSITMAQGVGVEVVFDSSLVSEQVVVAWKDGSGMVEPVQVQVVESRAGLGSQQKRSDPNFEVHPGDSYKALIQKMALARFREMS